MFQQSYAKSAWTTPSTGNGFLSVWWQVTQLQYLILLSDFLSYSGDQPSEMEIPVQDVNWGAPGKEGKEAELGRRRCQAVAQLP